MALFFVVVCAVGVLKPVRNAIALDGLGGTDFYQVYLISAGVIAFVPLFNRLSTWLSWRILFAVVAVFFAGNLVLFRIAYVPDHAWYALLFYGWYDLFAAALVTQFFMATQFFFDARSAKRAYPLVIAGGSIGATIGAAVSGFSVQSLGTANLLLVAAALLVVFAVGIPLVLPAQSQTPPRRNVARERRMRSDALRLAADPHVRLIAVSVLLTIVVKQLVDYQFNAIVYREFATPDAITSFQGRFNLATQWLPLVAIVAMRPALQRWGVASALLLLPAVMFGTTAALAIAFGVWTAVIAKGAETTLRYSVERAGREILYVPLPDEIKLKAKSYIDVGIEKGFGKVVAALLIMAALATLGAGALPVITVFLTIVWLVLAVAMRREYTRTLGRAFEGRFASVRGVFASIADASTLPFVRRALADPSPLRAAFALELLDQVPDADLTAVTHELQQLTVHTRAELRTSAWTQLARVPDAIDRAGARSALDDTVPQVREAAARALLASAGDDAPALLGELLRHPCTHVRRSALASSLHQEAAPQYRAAGMAYVEQTLAQHEADPEARTELALAAALHGEASSLLDPYLADPDPRVRSAALRSAGALRSSAHCARMIEALEMPDTRAAARDALALVGACAVEPLALALLDTRTPPRLRRAIPSALAEIPSQSTVDAMLDLVLAPETDQLLDYRTIRALSRLRARHRALMFNHDVVYAVAQRECDAARAYQAVLRDLAHATLDRDVNALFCHALLDAIRQRREGVFRCLGLLHDPEDVRRAHDAVSGESATMRASALEWLEQIIGNYRFAQLRPVLEPRTLLTRAASPATLIDDGDAWIALLARAVTSPVESEMELIEKVFLLQQVDLLRGARSAHVALLASVAEEIDVPTDTVLIQTGHVTPALFVVIEGLVALSGVGEHLILGAEEAFGAWGLVDDQPSPLEARTRQHTRLLHVSREDFQDLLADHPEVALGILQGVARRMRTLVA